MSGRHSAYPVADHRERTNRQPGLLAGLGALQAAGPLPTFLVGAVGAQVIDEFRLGNGLFGAILSCYFLTLGIAVPIGGQTVGRIGPRRGVAIASALTLTAVAGLGLLSTTWWIVGLCLVVAGTATSLGVPAGSGVISASLPRRRHGLAFGIRMATVPLGTAMAGAAVPLIALKTDWRVAMVLGTIFPVVALSLLLGGDRVSRAVEAEPTGSIRGDGFLVVLMAGFVGSVTVGAFSGFLIVSSVRLGVDGATAGWVAAIAGAISIVLRVVYGALVDRRSVDPFRLSALLLTIGAAGYVFLSLAGLPMMMVGALLGYGAGWGWSGLFLLGVVSKYPAVPATATGRLTSGIAFGQGVGPLLFGALADTAGDQQAWLALAALAAVGAILMWRASA